MAGQPQDRTPIRSELICSRHSRVQDCRLKRFQSVLWTLPLKYWPEGGTQGGGTGEGECRPRGDRHLPHLPHAALRQFSVSEAARRKLPGYEIQPFWSGLVVRLQVRCSFDWISECFFTFCRHENRRPLSVAINYAAGWKWKCALRLQVQILGSHSLFLGLQRLCGRLFSKSLEMSLFSHH